jgi:hypothetical protein
MFGLNLFDIGRFTETTTILWLRFVSIIIAAVGGYILYNARQQSKPSLFLTVVGSVITLIGVSSLLAYLLYGPTIARYTSDSCVYCPTIPVRISLDGGLKGTLPGTAPLPNKDPFTHTAVYDCLIDNLRPSGSTSAGTSFIRRNDLYELVVDSNTGALGIRILPDNGSPPVYMGKMPLQTFCQIAVVHNEKEISVFVNGVPRGSVVRENLPPTSAIQSQYIFNQDGVVRSGIIYQVQIHEGILSSEELMNANERVYIQYENDSTFQNTRIPTDNSRMKMTTSETILGYIRMLGGLFGYSSGVKMADLNTDIIGKANM